VLVDIDLEALAIPFVLPVRDGVANVVKERAAAQVDPANEHAAEVTEVANVVTGRAKQQWEKKLQTGQEKYKRTHGHTHGQKENAYLPVGEQDAL